MRKWGDMAEGSHPPVERRPMVQGKAAAFHCCPCRIIDQDMREVFMAMVCVQDQAWVMGLVKAAEAGFVS